MCTQNIRGRAKCDKLRLIIAALLTFGPLLANAIPLQYTGAVAGGGIGIGDSRSISFDYDSNNGFQNGSGPGQLSYVDALSNINIVTTAAISTTVMDSIVSVANVNFFGFEGYAVSIILDNLSSLTITLPFDIPGTSMALPNTLPSSDQIDLSRLGSGATAHENAGIHLQYQGNSNQTQFARFDFAPAEVCIIKMEASELTASISICPSGNK